MNIALIGAPGAGKSQLAAQIAAELGETVIIDAYVPELEERWQLGLGVFSSYIGNLAIALDRYLRERIARLDAIHTITCGTLIDTAVYAAINFAAMSQIVPEDGREELLQRIDATLRLLAVLYNDVFSYDHAFYLPPIDPSDDAINIDRQIQAGLGGFKLVEVTSLLEPEHQFTKAMAVLRP